MKSRHLLFRGVFSADENYECRPRKKFFPANSKHGAMAACARLTTNAGSMRPRASLEAFQPVWLFVRRSRLCLREYCESTASLFERNPRSHSSLFFTGSPKSPQAISVDAGPQIKKAGTGTGLLKLTSVIKQLLGHVKDISFFFACELRHACRLCRA
jgi:hypothetical protein